MFLVILALPFLHLLSWPSDANLFAASLKHPDDETTWSQKGIARYCFRVKDYEACLQHQKARGSKIYIENQRGE